MSKKLYFCIGFNNFYSIFNLNFARILLLVKNLEQKDELDPIINRNSKIVHWELDELFLDDILNILPPSIRDFYNNIDLIHINVVEIGNDNEKTNQDANSIQIRNFFFANRIIHFIDHHEIFNLKLKPIFKALSFDEISTFISTQEKNKSHNFIGNTDPQFLKLPKDSILKNYHKKESNLDNFLTDIKKHEIIIKRNYTSYLIGRAIYFDKNILIHNINYRNEDNISFYVNSKDFLLLKQPEIPNIILLIRIYLPITQTFQTMILEHNFSGIILNSRKINAHNYEISLKIQ